MEPAGSNIQNGCCTYPKAAGPCGGAIVMSRKKFAMAEAAIFSHERELELIRGFFGSSGGFFVDVGANDPKIDSQTCTLSSVAGRAFSLSRSLGSPRDFGKSEQRRSMRSHARRPQMRESR